MRYLTALLARYNKSSTACLMRRKATFARRLRCELLEPRNLMAVVTWDGGASDTNWHTPANWSSDTVPGVTDDVEISGTVDLSDSDVTVASLYFEGGVMTGTSDLAVSGLFTWRSGTLTGSGDLNANGGILIVGDSQYNELKFLDGRTLNNAGAAVWRDGYVTAYNGAVLNNLVGATFDIQSDRDLRYATNNPNAIGLGGVGARATINNAGTFRKTGNTPASGFELLDPGTALDVIFHNTGTVEAQVGRLNFEGGYTQTAGNSTLNGGSMGASIPLQILGGTTEGTGTIFSNLSNGGQVSPGFSPGLIDLHGSYIQTSTGAFKAELGGYMAGTQYDRLNVTGLVTLGGSLSLSVINGFAPVDDDLFTIIDNDSTDAVVGAFNGLPEGTIFSIPGGNQFKISYNGFGTSNDVVVKAINRPPVANAGGPYYIAEGSSLLLNGSGSYDPDPLDTLTYSWDVNGDGVFGDAIGVSPILTWTQLQVLGINDGPRTVPNVRVRVDDAHAHVVDSPVTTLTVTNVAPTVGAITAPVDPVAATTTINVSASFTDIGTRDTHTASWNWGDNSSSAGIVTETNGSGSVSGNHTYSAAGVYTVTLTVTDDDTGIGTSTFQYIVVYDPSAGFVTGGGWINSPIGAYAANPELTGKANFGFESKYLKGNNVPTGNTEFQFKLANFNFKSTSYEWLVVSGAKARYRGVGTVNGAGNYGFELTAWDGQVNGGGGVDRFRIKIWNNNQGNGVVYDNMMGAADGANPTTALGGGSIVIHTSAQPLLASGGTALATSKGLLTQVSLNQAVGQAITYWSNMGVEASAVSKLQQIHVEVADLSDAVLGIASDTNYVWIDRDAAGYGWQLDSLGGTYPSITGGMDLLSVIAHELGHKLGLEHNHNDSDIMAPTLDVGVRTAVGSVGQPFALFNASLVVSGRIQFDGTSPSVFGTLRLANEDLEENQARDQLFASLDDGPTKPLVRSRVIASKSQFDAKQITNPDDDDLFEEDFLDTIALAQLATHRQNN